MTELRRLSTDCVFGDTLSDMLRDRLVCGINEELDSAETLARSQLDI